MPIVRRLAGSCVSWATYVAPATKVAVNCATVSPPLERSVVMLTPGPVSWNVGYGQAAPGSSANGSGVPTQTW